MDTDDQETLDLTFESHDTEVLPDEDAVVTERLDALPDDEEELVTIELAAVMGGMNLAGRRESTNVEDRRTPAGKRRDAMWWRQWYGMETGAPVPTPRPVPIPTPRPDPEAS